jgi:hypothetical protein
MVGGWGYFLMVKNFKYREIIPVVSYFNSYTSWQQFSVMGKGQYPYMSAFT